MKKKLAGVDKADAEVFLPILNDLIPEPKAVFTLKEVADTIRSMSGAGDPADMLHDCDMHVSIGPDGQMVFEFYPKSHRRFYLARSPAPAR